MKTRKNYKRYLLLWVLLVNLLPGMKDGQLKWELMTVEAQQYIVEGMVDGQYKCVNTLDENDWFPSSTTSCLYAQVCACIHCGAEWDCDGPCPNPACPSNNESVDDGFGHNNYCQCCQVRKNDEDICINPACQCSPYYNSGTSDPGGGDTGSNSGGNTGGNTGSNQGSGSTPEGEDEEENDPCSGMKNEIMTGNPLLSMQIRGTINNGILGGCFGRARGRMHNGIDLSGSIGDPVYATHSGTVIRVEPVCPVETSGLTWEKYLEKYKPKNEKSIAPGKRVYIDCGGGFATWYMHLNSTNVQQNQQISAGDVIGTLGRSGSCNSKDAAGPHLHYQTMENGKPVNPMKYIFSDFDMETGIGTNCD